MAGRKPKPWFRVSKGAWFVCIGGKQINLGKDKDEAFRTFHRRMAEQGQEEVKPSSAVTVAELAGRYLADAQRRLKRNTLRVTKGFLDDFAQRHGSMASAKVRRLHAEQWVKAHPSWNGTYIPRKVGGIILRPPRG
jgi:hypothetical protein